MVKQDYDQLAEVYGRNRKLHPLVLKQLVSLGRLTDESRVLEIGCGIGNYIKTIAAKTGAICTGMDPSREMLRIAQSNHGLPKNRRDSGGADVTFIKGSAEEMPLADRQFDLAFSVDVIHHVQARDTAAHELFRVLKPGGTAAIVMESEDDIRNRTPQVAYFPDTIAVELGRYPTVEVIQQELLDAGFEVGETIPVSMPHQVTDLAPYHDKAFSSLHLISDEAFVAGIERMKQDFAAGSIAGVRRYTIITGRRPAQ